MRLPAIALLALLLPPAPFTLAQSIGEPIPGQGKAAGKERFQPQQTGRAARPCPEYGPGFVRIEGSSACVRASGRVQVEFGRRSRNGYGSAAEGDLVLEGRGQSAFGPVRTVVRMRGQIDRGLDSGPFRR